MLGNWQALLDYLRADMAAAPIERVRVLFLNTRNILIRDEVMAQGSIDQAPLYVREIIRRAIDLSAAAIIVVHNHPSGDPKPSRADIETTRLLVEAGQEARHFAPRSSDPRREWPRQHEVAWVDLSRWR